jgi:hypothetical protein
MARGQAESGGIVLVAYTLVRGGVSFDQPNPHLHPRATTGRDKKRDNKIFVRQPKLVLKIQLVPPLPPPSLLGARPRPRPLARGRGGAGGGGRVGMRVGESPVYSNILITNI